MVDVILYNPKYTDVLKIRGVHYCPPPLDLCYIAGFLEQNGFSVSIFDENVEGLDFIDFLAGQKPKVIGVTAPSLALPNVYGIVGRLQQAFSGVEVILTGQHVSSDSAVIGEMGLNYGLQGCCEQGFSQLCKLLLRGEGSLSDIPGLLQAGSVNSGKKASFGFNSILPARHLLKNERYKYASISASRGCPYNCVYCASTGPFYVHYDTYTVRKPKDIVLELKEAAEKHKIEIFDFVDDVFTYNSDYALALCLMMQEKKLNVKWTCSTRPDLITKELAVELRRAGCIQVCLGVESGSEKVRKNIGRDISDKEIKKAFEVCRHAGLRTRASAMLGLPGETKEEMEDTIEFVRELKPTYAMFYPTLLLPGSQLFDRA
ncbi:MAG: radical SAM protein, partial [Candidatus Altiarchaeales archaeon]|nr:radical SAM protein [Candidatus Altiarchaeales archaeon]